MADWKQFGWVPSGLMRQDSGEFQQTRGSLIGGPPRTSVEESYHVES